MLNSNSFIEQFKRIFEMPLKHMKVHDSFTIAEVLKGNIDQKVKILAPRETGTYDVYEKFIIRGQEAEEITNMTDLKVLLEDVIYSSIGITTRDNYTKIGNLLKDRGYLFLLLH
jgi:hypothetical protein